MFVREYTLTVTAYLKGKGLTSGCNLRWGVLFSQKGLKSADGKGEENFPFRHPYKKGKKESLIAGYSCWRASLKNAFARLQSFVWLMFCERDGAQRSIAFLPIILIFLTNKNSFLIYSVIICEQKNKRQCTVRDFRMINSQLHCCFHQLWCLPSLAASDVLLAMLWLLVPYNHVNYSIWKP